MDDKTLRELCADIGVSRRAIQGYEKIGLLQPSGKTARGYLLYDTAAQNKVRKIHQYQRFGFAVKDIKRLLDMPPAAQKPLLLRQLEILTQRRTETEAAIAELKATIDNL